MDGELTKSLGLTKIDMIDILRDMASRRARSWWLLTYDDPRSHSTSMMALLAHASVKISYRWRLVRLHAWRLNVSSGVYRGSLKRLPIWKVVTNQTEKLKVTGRIILTKLHAHLTTFHIYGAYRHYSKFESYRLCSLLLSFFYCCVLLSANQLAH